jgi:hypothetical protein
MEWYRLVHTLIIVLVARHGKRLSGKQLLNWIQCIAFNLVVLLHLIRNRSRCPIGTNQEIRRQNDRLFGITKLLWIKFW